MVDVPFKNGSYSTVNKTLVDLSADAVICDTSIIIIIAYLI